jgi:Uma2 family endonuclease
MPHSRRFVPGTTGWTEDDLNDPRLERLWDRGGYEIVEGVLTKMPPAYLEGSLPLRRLTRQIERHLEENSMPGEFAFEVDLVISRIRIPRVDAIFLTSDQLRRQAEIQAARKQRTPLHYGRLRLAPELVIEAISIGHEIHDRQTKRDWYAGFGVGNYWLLDPFGRTLECLCMADGSYRTDVAGKDQEDIAPAMFPGLTIRLGSLWI